MISEVTQRRSIRLRAALLLALSISAVLSLPVACVVTELGTSLEWGLSMGADMPASADVTIEDERLHVEIDRALVSIVSLEVLPCSGESVRLDRKLSWTGRAYAHGGETPTRMATPHVIDLLADTSDAWSSALSHPPPGAYCWVRVTIGPADRDAVGMPVDVNLTDSALLIRGAHQAVGQASPTAFSVTSTRTQSIDVAFVDDEGNAAPLVVSETMRDAAVDVWLESPAVLDGVDPTSAIEAQGGLRAITNLLASIHARSCVESPCGAR